MFPNQNSLIDARYRIIEQLGKGSFGETYKAIDTKRFNEIVVVKRLKVELYSGDYELKVKELFEREAEAYMKLGSNSSQIPRLEAYFEENNNFYLVMEYIDESNLSEQELKEGNILEEKNLIKLLKNILPIVQLVHNNDLVHRDIKPDNLIRRNSDKKIVLIDFGAVTNDLNIKHKKQTTGQKTTLGSIYAAPEQFHGEAYPCSDIYAVGMICIQALTGRQPENLPKDPMTGERLWETLTSASKDLKRVIRKMACSNTSERYQSVDEVLKDIDKIGNQSSKENNSQTISVVSIKVIIGSSALLGISLISIAIYKYMLFKNIVSQRISFEEMKQLCLDKNFYELKIRGKIEDVNNINNFEIQPIGLKLNPDNSLKEVIPAYRWRCVYKLNYKDNSPQGKFGITAIGLNLDKDICEKKYGNQGLIKAIYLHYDDPHSFYCVLSKPR